MIAATLGHRGMLTARFGSTRSLLTKLHMAAARWPGCLLRFVILDWTSNYPCETTQQKSRTGKAERITINGSHGGTWFSWVNCGGWIISHHTIQVIIDKCRSDREIEDNLQKVQHWQLEVCRMPVYLTFHPHFREDGAHRVYSEGSPVEK